MIGRKLLSLHLLRFAFAKVGNGVSETKIGHAWGTGSAGDYSRPRRGTTTTNPEDENLMGLIMTRLG